MSLSRNPVGGVAPGDPHLSLANKTGDLLKDPVGGVAPGDGGFGGGLGDGVEETMPFSFLSSHMRSASLAA